VAAALASIVAGAAPAQAPNRADPYADPAFTAQLNAGMGAFYARDFKTAQRRLEAAQQIAPADSLTVALLDATVWNLGAAEFTRFVDAQEAALARRGADAVGQTRLAFAYLFEQDLFAERELDAKEALAAALKLQPRLAAAHVGLGIYRLRESATNRAKIEFLAALRAQPHDVLAREYLADIYQNDLRDANRALSYLIEVPNLVPNYADGYFRLGTIMDDLGQERAALSYLQTAIALDKGHVGEAGQFGLPLLGQVYLKLHRIEDARKAFSAAVVYGERPDFSQEQLAKIKRGDYGGQPPR
jgi:tetratricopeptide (TPR) repeat protein